MKNTKTWRKGWIVFEKGIQTGMMEQAGGQAKEELVTLARGGRELTKVGVGWGPTWDNLMSTINFHVFFLFPPFVRPKAMWASDMVWFHIVTYVHKVHIFTLPSLSFISLSDLKLGTATLQPLIQNLGDWMCLELRLFQMLVKILWYIC